MLGELETATSRDERTRLPGDINIWIFVLGDLVYFAGYFAIFMVYRIEHRDLFLESQAHLNLTAAALNTLVLLASSRYVALAVQAARGCDHRRASRLIAAAIVSGSVFALVKAYEWTSEISRGFTLPSNEFFMFYYMLTGVHLVHVILGIGGLLFVRHELREPDLRREWVVEAGATYWHMVDLVWIFIFALIYLMR